MEEKEKTTHFSAHNVAVQSKLSRQLKSCTYKVLTARQLREKQARGWPIIIGNFVIAEMNWLPYLGIKQSVGVLDVLTLTVYSIVWSWWNVHVYIWHAKLKKSSQQTAQIKNSLHDLLKRIKENSRVKKKTHTHTHIRLFSLSSNGNQNWYHGRHF